MGLGHAPFYVAENNSFLTVLIQIMLKYVII